VPGAPATWRLTTEGAGVIIGCSAVATTKVKEWMLASTATKNDENMVVVRKTPRAPTISFQSGCLFVCLFPHRPISVNSLNFSLIP
jgi:hypothetical protein